MEWVEKASFSRLNKLFEIDAAEWAHNFFLSDTNLHALIEYPMPFIILVFSRLASPSLVSHKHFVLNDLLFYKVACLADSEACQTYLEERDKKHKEGTLRQAQVASHLASSFVVRLYAQNKKPVTRPVQKVGTPPPAFPSSLSFFFFFFSFSSSNDETEVRDSVDAHNYL